MLRGVTFKKRKGGKNMRKHYLSAFSSKGGREKKKRGKEREASAESSIVVSSRTSQVMP